MEFVKPTRQLLSNQVFDLLYRNIETGVWPVGSKIPAEPELIQSLEVSRNTLREAVQSLVHAGVLQARQGDGTYVRHRSGLDAALDQRLKKADPRETLEVRRALEMEVSRLAAGRRSNEDLEELQRLLYRQRQAAVAGDRETYLEADLAFHQGVAAAARNPMLLELYRDFEGALRLLVVELMDRHSLTEHCDIHVALWEAIRDRDEARAAQVTQDFIGVLLEEFEVGR